MGLFDWLFGSDEEDTQQTTQTVTQEPPQFVQAPEYPESEAARASWWKKLQEWSTAPGYGAIAPNWGDIFNRASKRISQYYWGSPTSPGFVGKVRASAARRNVSESPALEEMITRMGAEEGGRLSDLATEQAIQEALFSEQGRSNWLTSLMNLSGMRPSGTFYNPSITTTGTTTAPYRTEGAFMPLMQLGGGIFGQMQQQSWWEKILKDKSIFGGGGAGTPSELPTSVTETPNWMEYAKLGSSLLPMFL